MMTINYGAVLVCGIAAMVVGFVWYGVFFKKAWASFTGIDLNMSPEQMKIMQSKMGGMYALQFVLSLITAFVLSFIVSSLVTSMTSVCVAVVAWFGFVMTTTAGAFLWSGKPKKVAWKMFLISAGGELVTFAIFGYILGMWQ